MRRAAAAGAAALALLAAGAPAARAQTEVSGGGDLTDAPTLRPGTYADTLLPQETLYYAVDLRPGQVARARIVVDLSTSRAVLPQLRQAGSGVLLAQWSTPLLQDANQGGTSIGQASPDGQSLSVEVASEPVTGTTPATPVGGGAALPLAGRWVLSVELPAITTSLGPRVELPVRIELAVDGAPTGAAPRLASDGSDPLSLPGRAIAAAQLTPATRREVGPERGAAPAALVGAGAGGLLLGLLGALALAGRRRRGA